MPEHHQVQRFYDEKYYARECDDLVLPWHMRMVASRLGTLKGKSVLDVACGTGVWLKELQKRGAQPCGIDISSLAVQRACLRLPAADIREGVGEELPFESDRFDLVTCMGSLEHFLDQPRALKEMLRVGRGGATFLLLVPNAGFLTRRLGLYGGTGQVAIRETVRPINEWARMFEDAGLRVRAKWRDLHPLSRHWICSGSPMTWPVRAMQAAALAVWPTSWQYQVYFLCDSRSE